MPNDRGHLIVVCCHAIFNSSNSNSGTSADPTDEAQWELKPFQRSTSTGKPGEHLTFIQHIKAGWDIYLRDRKDRPTLLLFSGGATGSKDSSSANLAALTEAESYLHALTEVINSSMSSEKLTLQTQALPKDFLDDTFIEPRATDSYQNLLFSVLEYWRWKGTWPHDITIVTHAFKAKRFLELHAKAIGWPESRIRVLGIDPHFSLLELEETISGEKTHGYDPWQQDPYGVGPSLAQKRRSRNWDATFLDYICSGAPEEVQRLLRWTGGPSGSDLFSAQLPWSE